MTALVYVLLCLIWGSTWIAIKIGLQQAPPMYTAAIRFLLSVLILGGIAWYRGYSLPRSSMKLAKLGYPGLYMFGISYGLVYLAEQHIDSSLTAVLFGTFPIWVAAFSHFRLPADKLHSFAWIGLLVGFSGVVMISVEQWQLSGELFMGTLFALGGTIAAAHGVVIHKKNFSQENIVVASCVQMAFGGIPLLIAALAFESPDDFMITPESIGSIVYLAVLGSVTAFLLYFWLLKKTTAVVVSLIAFVTPLVAIFIGVMFFSESMSLMIALGTSAILSGIIAVIKKPEEPLEATEPRQAA